MSLQSLGNIAKGYSHAMDMISTRVSDPELIKDPAKLAQFQIELYYATTGFQMTSRVTQDLHKEDQQLTEMLRDA